MKIRTKILICVGIIIPLLGFSYHAEEYHPAVTHVVPAVSHVEPVVTRTVTHPAIIQKGDCIRANINYDYIGRCATGRCADGTYTGTPHVNYYKTCNYHDGLVVYGPFYYPDKILKAEWTETIVEKPSRIVIDKHPETVVDKEAYTTVSYWTYFGIRI